MTNNTIENINFFPTLVRRIKNFLSVNECKLITENMPPDVFSTHPALWGSATSSHTGSSTENNALDHIEKIISINDRLNKSITEFEKAYGMKDSKIDNSWMNIQRPESLLKAHAHPSSIISGALYIKVDDQSSKLYFFNPNPYIDFVEYYNEPTGWTSYNYRTSWIIPEVGDLVLFPSWFKHGSEDINKSEERIVLSFNTRYK